MKKSLYQLENKVKRYLERSQMARVSDEHLYFQLCKDILAKNGIHYTDINMKTLLLDRDMLRLPKFESVRRVRQKLQHDHPELRPSENIAKTRKKNEKKMREYARI